MEKICPRCGVSSKSRSFVGTFCIDCKLKDVKIEIPSKIKIQSCKSCGRIKFANWQERSKELLEKIIAKHAKGEFEGLKISHLNDGRCSVSFLVRFDLAPFEVKRELEINFDEKLCEECYRKVSGYYEAIIQLRGDKKKVDRFFEKLRGGLAKRTFISKLVEHKNGIDIYVGSRDATAEILSYYNLKPSISDKLYGIKEGKRLFRRTYCIRL